MGSQVPCRVDRTWEPCRSKVSISYRTLAARYIGLFHLIVALTIGTCTIMVHDTSAMCVDAAAAERLQPEIGESRAVKEDNDWQAYMMTGHRYAGVLDHVAKDHPKPPLTPV